MKYAYPAIFTPEADGQYSIRFPDLEGCYTAGESLEDGLEMANDVLCLTLYNMEEKGETIPLPTDMKHVETSGEEFVTLVACDTIEYRKIYDGKAVKKTLTLPSWLNVMAERAGINFSSTLQNALKQELNI